MGFLKFWHISLFFIASTVFANNNSTREGRFFFEPLYELNEELESYELSLLGGVIDFFKVLGNWTVKLIDEIFKPDADVNVEYYVAQNIGSNASFCKIHGNSNKNGCKYDFVKNNRLTILIHGYLASYETDWISNMKQEVTRYKNRTVIAINWGINRCLGGVAPVQNTPLYDCAFENIGRVIKKTAMFLEYTTDLVKELKKSNVNPWADLHIVGHSMGAHIAGKVAEKLQKKGIKVNRVTGLDPALPCFKETGSKWMLDKSQADFVDVIHTNSRPSDDSTLGLYRNIGHVDIYPDYGNNQTDCIHGRGLETLFTCETLQNVGIELLDNYAEMVCNHGKATEYMALSLKNTSCDYRAVPWDDIGKLETQSVNQVCKNGACVKMGFKATKPSNQKSTETKYYIDMAKLDGNCRTLH